MQPEKKQLEILRMQYFRECYPDFPKGKIVPSESPDFIVILKSRNHLGIEMTRLNPKNASIPDDLRLTEIAFREHLIGFAKDLFEQSSPLNLFVKFLFSETNKIAPEREVAVAAQTVNAIRNAIGNRNSEGFFRESILKDQLPEGLDEVFIASHPDLKISMWERSNNLGVSENVVDDIRMAIRKKDEKLRLYQKQRLNYYWLVITTDRLRGVKSYNLPDKILNHTFQSRFQQVFLFDLIKSDIFRLV